MPIKPATKKMSFATNPVKVKINTATSRLLSGQCRKTHGALFTRRRCFMPIGVLRIERNERINTVSN